MVTKVVSLLLALVVFIVACGWLWQERGAPWIQIADLCPSPDQRNVAYVVVRGRGRLSQGLSLQLRCRDLSQGREVVLWQSPRPGSCRVSWSKDGKDILCSRGQILVQVPLQGGVASQHKVPAPVPGILSPDGQLRVVVQDIGPPAEDSPSDPIHRLFVSSHGGPLRRLSDGNPQVNHDDPIWSPNSRMLLYRESSGRCIVDVSTGKLLGRYPADDSAWSRDSKRLAYAGSKGSQPGWHVVDIQSGQDRFYPAPATIQPGQPVAGPAENWAFMDAYQSRLFIAVPPTSRLHELPVRGPNLLGSWRTWAGWLDEGPQLMYAENQPSRDHQWLRFFGPDGTQKKSYQVRY